MKRQDYTVNPYYELSGDFLKHKHLLGDRVYVFHDGKIRECKVSQMKIVERIDRLDTGMLRDVKYRVDFKESTGNHVETYRTRKWIDEDFVFAEDKDAMASILKDILEKEIG